ncbi:methyltransferase domain-containing protein, partial [Candidatus Roizmanbacteria bacterium]|nr:methyltransferase domain-containing protein [Candidatus Roizmanbacteria bacterium]
VIFDQYYAKYRTKRFDFITIIHTIEHVTDPQTMISKAIKLLNFGGILFIETPNLDSHLFYAEKLRYTFLTPPDHIWLFSLKSFKNMFKRLRGVKLEKISTYSYPEHFMGIIKSKLLITNYKLQINVKLKNPNEKTNSQNKKRKFIKYLLFDRLLAPLFTPLLNIGIKGSILELYISKI